MTPIWPWTRLSWNFDVAWQRVVDDRTTRDYEAEERQYESNRSDLYGATVSASGKNEQSTWIFGAELYYDRVRSARHEESIANGLTQILPSRFPDNSTINQAAIYGSIDHGISERQLLSVGLRFSNVSIHLPATEVSVTTSVDVSDISGDLGWVYSLNSSSSLIANIGFGFRAPNVFDLGTLGNRPGNRFNIPNTNLDSEYVVQGDLGIRHHSNRWNFDFVLFTLQYDNRITSVLTVDVTADGRDIVQSVNAARSNIRGVEFGLDVSISETLSTGLILNYTHGEQRVGGSPTEPADRIPPLNGKLHLKFDSGSDWLFDGWVEYSSRQDRLSARDIRDIRINPTGSPGWGIIGMRARWNPDPEWQLMIGANNLLDKRYRMHGSGLDANGRNLSLSIHRIWQ